MSSNLESANKYFKARLANDIATCLTFVSDDIELVSARDGTHKGREAFEAYLKKTPPSGTWDDSATAEGDKCVIRGKTKFMFMNVSVKATMTFNAEGKICHIIIERDS